jgi:hypothetical protein
MQDWPVDHGARAIGRIFKVLPIDCQMQILLDSEEVDRAFQGCTGMIEYTTVVQWEIMFRETRQKGITREVRKFDDEANAEPLRMNMMAMWEAKETTQRAVSDRDNPIAFLAWEIRWRETALPSNGGFAEKAKFELDGSFAITRTQGFYASL